MGKPAATDRRRLKSLNHSFTLDFVVLCNGTKAQALVMKGELHGLLATMGLTLSEAKTHITHITEGFDFLGYTIIRSMGTRKLVPKVLIPVHAIKRFREKVREIVSPRTISASVTAKMMALNALTRGWCEYYRCTSSIAWGFNHLNEEIFWGMAHWLGYKYKATMPTIMRKFRQGNTLGTPTIKLIMPNEYTHKRLVPKTWYNPYTAPEKVKEEKARIKRESLFTYDQLWTGEEDRSGWSDRREEVLLQQGPSCRQCGTTGHPSEVQVDHIIPRARFKDPTEADRLGNLQVLCTQCHRAKTQTDRKVLSRVR